MGSYKLGAECCNNCVHWDAERDDKHGKENVFSYKNCAKCTSSHSPNKGRSTLAENACPYFSHIWGITKTFSISGAGSASTASGGATTSSGMDALSSAYLEGVAGPDIGQTYINGLMEGIKAKAARRAEEQIATQRAREQERLEAQRARDARKMEILVKNGMDPNASSDEQFEFELLCRAASGDDADSLCKIGEACYAGTCGAKEDPEKGVMYFKKAANMGSAQGNYLLGCAYCAGKGVEESKYLAFTKFQKAAELGHVESQYRLGECYVMGYSLETDILEGLKWYKKAAEGGNAEAEKSMHDAISKLRSLADSGDAKAMNQVGVMYYNGKVVDQDFDEARFWFEKAAEAGVAAGMRNCGEMYRDGAGGAVDMKIAVRWFVLAAAHGDEQSQNNLEKLSEEQLADAFADPKSFLVLEVFIDRKAPDNKINKFKGEIKRASDGDFGECIAMAKEFCDGVGGCVKNEVIGKMLLRLGEAKAESGDASAQYQLGDYYRFKDGKRAVRLLQQSAEQGFATAEGALGYFYWFGKFVEEDEDMAISLWRRAILHGDKSKAGEAGLYCRETKREAAKEFYKVFAEAAPIELVFQTGAGYYLGSKMGLRTSDEQDYELAFVLLLGAAERGYRDALYLTGRCFREGLGTETNLVEAFKWFKMSAEAGDAHGQYELGYALGKGAGVERNYVEAFNWFVKSAEQGNPAAQINVGDFYKTGKGVGVDYEKALMWYEKALGKSGAKAKLKIGQLYLDGKGVKKDEAKAFSLLEESAEEGNGMAMAFCGLLCKDGRGTDVNKEKAYEWFKKSAEKGVANGKLCLARAYRNGDGVARQLEKARELFKELAEIGNPRGCYLYGDMLEKGEGGDADINEAKVWFKKSADAGDKDAKSALERLG